MTNFNINEDDYYDDKPYKCPICKDNGKILYNIHMKNPNYNPRLPKGGKNAEFFYYETEKIKTLPPGVPIKVGHPEFEKHCRHSNHFN